MSAAGEAFGARLRWWRDRRGLSQLDLAGVATVSQRHVSFLESGRTQPSRDMVLRLAAALELPLRQQNALLAAAGFAPAWQEGDLATPALAPVAQALEHMLRQQEPYPAVVVDRRWNLLKVNAGAVRLVSWLLGGVPEGPVNLAEALVSPAALRPWLANWEAVAGYFLRGVQADALADGTAETEALLQRLLAYPGVAALAQAMTEPPQAPVLAMHFRKDAVSLELFTTIATLGTPLDITLQELRVECFFPTDATTTGWFQGAA